MKCRACQRELSDAESVLGRGRDSRNLMSGAASSPNSGAPSTRRASGVSTSLRHSYDISRRVSELLAAAPTILQLFLICGDSRASPSEPRRDAPASGMRARARVRSAEAPRPADPGHRSPPPGAAQARGISSSPWQAFPGRGGGLSHQLLAGPRPRKDARPSALSISPIILRVEIAGRDRIARASEQLVR